MTCRALVLACALVLTAPAPAHARTVSAPRAAVQTLVGERAGDLAGASVAPAGDFDGDGRPDLIVGAPLADPLGRTDAGAAYIVFGGGSRGRIALGDRGLRIAGAVPLPRRIRHPGQNPFTSGAGSVVAGLGDVNGDGLADVAVSGREAGWRGVGDVGTTTAVFVVFGRRDRAPVDLAALGGGGFVIRAFSGALDIFDGRSVGDVTGDGLADIGVTAVEQMGEDNGHVVVVPGRADSAPVVIDELPAILGTGSMELGRGLAPAGDLNRDGFGDVLLGAPAPGYPGKPGRGAVFVLYGSATPAAYLRWGRPFSGFEVDGPPATREFGYAVARAGRGFVAGAPGRGRGGAWIVARRGARPVWLAPPRYGRPFGEAVAWTSRARALVSGRERALLYSRDGRVLVTYRDLRPGRDTPVAVAAAGGDVLLGSPGANRAYVVAG
jgi:hypothetical protein